MLDEASAPASRFAALAEIEDPRRAEGKLYRLPAIPFLYP
jgi:hypothetical protein